MAQEQVYVVKIFGLKKDQVVVEAQAVYRKYQVQLLHVVMVLAVQVVQVQVLAMLLKDAVLWERGAEQQLAQKNVATLWRHVRVMEVAIIQMLVVTLLALILISVQMDTVLVGLVLNNCRR